ncbi:hypothetical protein M407DRAFT_241720 [Tulasnella calospora MUT 4182]|uniref:NAD(P)-binding protein n=1 Tax=Tulasnella calospora MUT 4182 TaxID=1051891 RepID=A0A0C3QRZ5_9AGAM|nr:hypothetical protein M407DRAFT_241720 [Tulasnella calospora MUT 4182]
MPSNPSLSEVKASNASTTWSHRPTAVFVGGTSGIGEATARALATATKGRVQIILVGRSRARAEAIFASFPRTPESQYDFIQCEVSNMKNIVNAAQEIRSKLTNGTLNYLVLSQGIWLFVEPKQVLNGIDHRLVLNFYSRWKFVDELMPLVEKAAEKGEEARVMTVLNPNDAGSVDVSDLGRKTTTSGLSLAKAATAYSNVMIEEYPKLHPNLAFYNIFPGVVSTPNMNAGAWWSQPLIAIARMLIMIKPEESGERMLSALLNPEYKKGGFYLDQYAGQVNVAKENEEVRKAVLDHYRSEVAV